MKVQSLLICMALAVALGGCVTTTKIDSGERKIGDRLNVVLDGAWNQISAPGINGPHRETWTMEGLAVDQLLIYSGLRDGEAIHPDSAAYSDKKHFIFRADMQPEQVVSLFEGMLTRDGSSFRLKKLEPSTFGGGRGFHFEYALIRKTDNVELAGSASAVVNHNELFAIVYQAPQLVFFPRHAARVANMMRSARL